MKIIKLVLIYAAAALLVFFCYRLLIVRTVSYEIAGVKIPSIYNVFTGKVTPIPNYKGKANLPPLEPRSTKSIGLSKDEIAKAKFRWALFAQWVSARPEYKGWDKDKAVSDRAHKAFKEDMKKFKGSVAVI